MCRQSVFLPLQVRCTWSLALGVAMLGVWGCGGADVGFQSQPVGGVVLFNGEPVEGATVSFSPDSGSEETAGVPAVGRTRPDGTFSLRALQSGLPVTAGTAVGQYIVTVVKQEIPALSDPEFANNPPPVVPPEMLEPKDLLPAVYGSTVRSPLRAEVREGDNQFRFELVEPESVSREKTKSRRK